MTRYDNEILQTPPSPSYFSIPSVLALCTLFLFLIGISGCATQKEVSLGSKEYCELPVQAPDLDPELQPVEAEPEIVLNQELEALAQTGRWEKPKTADPIKEMTLATAHREPVEPLYDFPVVINRQVEMYIDLFQGKQRKYFARWLSRSGRYRQMIHAELENAGLPKDLLYLSMIESGFNQRAYSKSKATGLWQFMSGTGRDYGLSITKYVDERRDAEKSTQAAVAYLKDLYDEFGDWYLAVAAYNGGPGTMRKAMRNTKSNDFWKIAQKKHLRLETKRYVPKLIAAIIIAKEPEKYGFTSLNYEKPLEYDTFEVGPGLSLAAVAMLTNSDQQEIKRLNQELRTTKTPLDTKHYQLKIPAGTKEIAETNLPRLHSVVTIDYKTHIVTKNETLSKICSRYNINTTTLLKVNNLKSSKLKEGSRLRIPYQTVAYRILPEGMDARTAARDELVLHTVKKGETISQISSRYQVPAELIVAWNGLPSVHKITAGQQLALYMNSTGPRAAASQSQTAAAQNLANDNRVVVLSRTKKQAALDLQSSETVTWYQVRQGDSLWTISRQFNTSPDHIKRWNNLKSNMIHPGSRLKLIDV